MSSPRHIAIVGGGVTGLSAAYFLQKKAQESGAPVQLTLVESSNRIGGKIVTERHNEFIFEGGPDSFVTDKPWGLELAHELGLGDQLIPSNQEKRKIYILNRGRLVEFPSGFRLTIPTEIWPFVKTPLISWPGKIRMGFDLFAAARQEDTDESLAQFIRRRLGAEALAKFAAPLMAGIFTADAEKLSMKAAFPTFLAMEKKHRSLLLAARAAKKNPPPRRAGGIRPAGDAMFNSFKRGMSTLTDELAKRFTGDLRLETRVTSIARNGSRYTLLLDGANAGVIEADAVILAAPAYACAKMVANLHAGLAEQLRAIRYVSTASIALSYFQNDIPSTRPLDGYGVVIPATENRRINACTWTSTKFRHRAPPGTVLLRSFVGGHRDEEAAGLPDAELIAIVRKEYEELFHITTEPMHARIFRWPRGNVQYDVGHLDRVAEIEKTAAELPGLQFAGCAFRGIGIPDCIRSAKEAVEIISAGAP